MEWRELNFIKDSISSSSRTNKKWISTKSNWIPNCHDFHNILYYIKMRSIKINSRLGEKMEKQKTDSYPYMHLINNSNGLSFQRKMGSVLSELCQLI